MISLKEVNEKIGLKSGMCLTLIYEFGSEQNIILFQHGEGPLCFIDKYVSGWAPLCIDEYKYERIKVYNSPTGYSIFHERDLIYDSDWEDVVELTWDEIAKKLGINPRKLRIKNV